jgi:alcohol dehydrogenase class IV
MIFNIDLSTKVIIGEDACLQTGKELKNAGISKVLCVYDQGIKSIGIIEKIFQNIISEDIKVVEYGDITPDPPDTIINKGGELGRGKSVEAVVGIGGGSSLDAAKAINVLLGNPGLISDYYGIDVPQKPCKPLILIPTTAGTGSEISKVAVVSDSTSGKKCPILGPNCTASLAIVDPLLTLELPPGLTASTGVDALAHALEAYTSSLSSPFSDILAIEAISLIASSLTTAVKDGSNVNARYNMSLASTLAGMAFKHAPPHIGHAIGTPLGGRYHLAHGLTIAAVLPIVPEYIADVLPDKMRTVSKAMNINLEEEIPVEQIGIIVGDAINDLNKKIGIPTLKKLKIPESDLPAIAEEAMGDPLINIAPKKANVDDILHLLRKIYAA